MNRAFVGMGSNADHPRERLEEALVAMEAAGLRVAAVATPVSGPYVGTDGNPVPGAPDVLNTVAEVGTDLEPSRLLDVLRGIESRAGRIRGEGPVRTLDLDLLDVEDWGRLASATLWLPHPRATSRAFVLEPWAEIAPRARLSNPLPLRRTAVEEMEADRDREEVMVHAARLRARDPAAFASLRRHEPLLLPPVGQAQPPEVHREADGIRGFAFDLAHGEGALALVPTMGALHAGHAALVRRARAAGKTVVATVFVNPLQFGPQEDLARYPRTLDADIGLLTAAGAAAVYVPGPEEVYPPGYATFVVPEGPAQGFEGAVRPGHFRGVATVVLRLLSTVRPAMAWFGQKDAQQVAVVRRMVEDLDLDVQLEVAPTVRDVDGLALSSRNRYLSPEERARVRAFPAALEEVAWRAAGGERAAEALLEPARARLAAAGLPVDYLALVDSDAFRPLPQVGPEPALVVAAVRAGTTRLLDNRWVVVP